MFVKKRDGRKQKFNKEKIITAIESAFESVDGEVSEQAVKKAKEIANYIESLNKYMDVEEIQDIVEDKLMKSTRRDVAKHYILYREERTKERERNTQFMKSIDEKIHAKNVKNQNANVDEKSFGGRVGESSDELMRKYALDYLLSDKAKYNHLNNRIYIHDLNSYAVGNHNCLTVPIDDLLKNGFNTRQLDVRPANSIETAMQLVAVVFQIQSLMQFGGVSASHIDYSMVPYVRKSFVKHIENGLIYIEHKSEYKTKRFKEWLSHDPNHPDGLIHFDDIEFKNLHPEVWEYAMDMTTKETYQAVEGMFHNLNTLQSRSGNQLPFSSICYGTCTLEEGRLVTKAILDNSIKGGGKLHKTYIFPCQIFKVAKGINKEPNTPNYDLYKLALKSTAQRLYPNYANVDWSTNQNGNDGSIDAEMSTMGKV